MRSILILCSLFILFASCSLAIKRSTKLYQQVSNEKKVYDAIIVPGVPLKNGEWDSVMKSRVLWSVYLYRNNFAKNIIYSGSAVYTHFYEARVMGMYALGLGIPAEHIFYDTMAKHSTENVYYSYKLARTHGFKSIALATDPFQSILLKGFTRKRFGTEIQHIPVQYDLIRQMNVPKITIDSTTAFQNGFNSILDEETFLQRLKGTLGRQIYFGPNKKLSPL